MSQINTPQTDMNIQDEVMEILVDRNAWLWGFTVQAETWNGRFAMIGFVAAIAIEILTHQGVLRFWGLI
jgi:hypothetical protein